MGRKKGGKGNTGGGGEQQQQQRASSSDDAAPEQQQQAAAAHERPVEDLSVEELRAELRAARAALKVAAPSQLAAPQSQDVTALQSKLNALRQEQAEADAARDKAWRQLKAVVSEISSLANPDYLSSLVVKPQES